MLYFPKDKPQESSKSITLLLPWYLVETFIHLFNSMGFSVIHSHSPEVLEREINQFHIDLALEWQHGPEDYPIRNLLRKYKKEVPIFLSLNWNTTVPSNLWSLGYQDYLTVPYEIDELMGKFYQVLPESKKPILKDLWKKVKGSEMKGEQSDKIDTKGGSFTAMTSDLSNPPSFAIGPYNLDMSIVGLEGLVEITPAEYKVLPKTFKGEKIFKAPELSFLGFSWNMMLGVVAGKIYKISPSLMLQGKSQADEAAMKVLAYCKSELGEPAQQQTGSFMWHTSDGNVILENLETSFGFVINLFFTSGAVRSFQKRGWFTGS